MAKFSRRMGWLKNLFPPATAFNIQPGEFGEDIIPTHLVLNGTDRLGQFFTFSANGAAGITTVNSGAAPQDKYWFVFACHLSHNDPVARDCSLMFNQPAVNDFQLAAATALPTSHPLPLGRSIIIPPRIALKAECPALAAAQILSLRFLYLELDLGEPAPPSP